MKFFIILITLLFINCNSKPRDYQKDYDNRILFVSLIKPKADPAGKCKEASTSTATCIVKATDKSPLVGYVTDELYTVSILSNGKFTTYVDYCADAIKATSMKDLSDYFKECTFNCQKIYWDTVYTVGNCDKNTTADLFSGIGNGTKACFINCAKQSNN
jgi:hypothetical protein